MKSGYGRGYYGAGQLDKQPARGGSWLKIALVAGAGAALWYLWPRRDQPVMIGEANVTVPPPPAPVAPLPVAPHASLPASQESTHVLPAGHAEDLTTAQLAEQRGYPSQEAYETAVVQIARELKAEGAQIVLAPHLRHLAPRIEGDLSGSAATPDPHSW